MTMHAARSVIEALREVFAHLAYLGLAALLGLTAFVAQLWLPNYRLLAAVFAAGCAACGSFLLVTLLSALGATGALALLPLRGGELGLASVALLSLSIVLIARKIAAPMVCEIAPPVPAARGMGKEGT